jgi:protein O-GlcNAc transferase
MSKGELERLEKEGHHHKRAGNYSKAAEIFNTLLGMGYSSPCIWRAIIEINLTTNTQSGFAVATALRLYPRDSVLACHAAFLMLVDRKPALARRQSFKERLLASVGKPSHSKLQSSSNILASLDQTGRSDLTPCLHDSLQKTLPDLPRVYANTMLQLASQAHSGYPKAAKNHASIFPASDKLDHGKRHAKQKKKTRIGLISPDFYYHPVGRFIYMMLTQCSGNKHDIKLISTGEKDAIPGLAKLMGDQFIKVSRQSPEAQLETIRQLELDVAIDLAGWTGENNGWLFARRVAPVQVNYLGYFASSGLPAMDVWLGDHVLFPSPMQEWHSEQIMRLSRPFLAWQPSPDLPEGRVAVPPPPSGAPIFGCFNHVRKLSSATLKLWGQLMKAVPGAKLVLKAYTSDDPAVMRLLERRMRRFGLNPEAVIWLPTCPKPEDHLRQYGLIDIALDPFPNGGCTTTCEALWMGVPVITWCGSHYVSRMSAAVLIGANLPEWVAYSEAEYLELAVKAAANVQAVRANRPELRAHLQNSPLGDAADLSTQLWSCLEQLV